MRKSEIFSRKADILIEAENENSESIKELSENKKILDAFDPDLTKEEELLGRIIDLYAALDSEHESYKNREKLNNDKKEQVIDEITKEMIPLEKSILDLASMNNKRADEINNTQKLELARLNETKNRLSDNQSDYNTFLNSESTQRYLSQEENEVEKIAQPSNDKYESFRNARPDEFTASQSVAINQSDYNAFLNSKFSQRYLSEKENKEEKNTVSKSNVISNVISILRKIVQLFFKDIVKSLTNARPDKFTAPQSAAIKAYTGKAYKNINEVNRGLKNHDGSKVTFEGENEKHSNELTALLSNMKTPEDCIVYRGADNGKIKKEGEKSLIGKEIYEKGFLSTTLDKEKAFRSKILFEISVPKGAPGLFIGELSSSQNEMEVLFNRNMFLKIIDVEIKEGGRIFIKAQMKLK